MVSSVDQEICQIVSPLKLIRKAPSEKKSKPVDGCRSALGLGMLHFSLGCHLKILDMPRPELSDDELKQMGIPASSTAHYRIFYNIIKKIQDQSANSHQPPIEQYPPVESCLKPTIATLAGWLLEWFVVFIFSPFSLNILGYKGLQNWNKGRLETLCDAASQATQAMSMMSLAEEERETDVVMKCPENKDAQDLLLWRLKLLFHRTALAINEDLGRDPDIDNVEVSRSFRIIFVKAHFYKIIRFIYVQETAPPMKYAAVETPTQPDEPPINQSQPRRAPRVVEASPGPGPSCSNASVRRGRGGGKGI